VIARRKKLVNPRRDTFVQRVNRSDGKSVEICRTAIEWEERRAELCERASHRCEICFRIAPLHDTQRQFLTSDGTAVIRFFPAGHAHHKERRGLGGGNRNDALDGLVWLCEEHHKAAHDPTKSVPAKVDA
jgi:hypothetical protein